jgi:hypothetical protein
VIAGGRRDDSPAPLLLGELNDPVVSTANLEREDGLHVFPLEPHVVTQADRQIARGLQRGLHGRFVHTRGENLFNVLFHGNRMS